jgi:hypothetical protein
MVRREGLRPKIKMRVNKERSALLIFSCLRDYTLPIEARL